MVLNRLQVQPQLNEGPLRFWQKHSFKLPFLAAVAFQILGIPASTAQVERLFSAAGRAIGRRRPRLRVKRAAQLIYSHSNVCRGITGRALYEHRQKQLAKSEEK